MMLGGVGRGQPWASTGQGLRRAFLGPALAPTSVALSAALVGSQLHRFPELSPTAYLVAPLAMLALAVVLAKRPRRALAILIVGTVFGAYTAATAVGSVNLRLTDLPYAVLVVWAVVRRVREGPRRGSAVGQRQLALLVGVFGISLLPIVLTAVGTFTDPFVSWLRLVQTVSLVWLIPYVLDGPADRRFVLQVIALAATAAIVAAIFRAAQLGRLGDRLHDATLGPNSIGLLAALLVVIALHFDVTRRPSVKVLIVAVGVLGLVMTRSIASITATGLVLGIFGLRRARGGDDFRRHALLALPRLLLLAVGVLGLISILRPNDLPWSRHFSTSSAQIRVVLATGGLDLFSRNPILGVGWQRSSGPEALGTRELADRLRARFSAVDPQFLPNEEKASTVHNAYVQVLAESGLVGFSLLVITLVAARRGIRGVLWKTRQSGEIVAHTAMCCLVVILIWWNDNPLYGAQAETVLTMTLLGVLASYGLARDESSPDVPEEYSAHGALTASPQALNIG